MGGYTNSKPLYASRTFWGGVIAILAGAAGMIGYAVGPDDQAQLVEIVTAAASAVGGVAAIAGRIMATKPIE
ncbi:MAG: hypothetical protein LDL30_04580 [Desulfovibrio sp.]|nr:hypothetical protein [Desulfovibrio sp.]